MRSQVGSERWVVGLLERHGGSTASRRLWPSCNTNAPRTAALTPYIGPECATAATGRAWRVAASPSGSTRSGAGRGASHLTNGKAGPVLAGGAPASRTYGPILVSLYLATAPPTNSKYSTTTV